MFKKIIEKEVNAAKAEIKAEIKEEISGICSGMVNELFSETKDEVPGYWPFGTAYVKTLRGEIKEHIISAAKSRFDEDFKIEAMRFVEGEAFIDSVVERIQKKQLGQK